MLLILQHNFSVKPNFERSLAHKSDAGIMAKTEEILKVNQEMSGDNRTRVKRSSEGGDGDTDNNIAQKRRKEDRPSSSKAIPRDQNGKEIWGKEDEKEKVKAEEEIPIVKEKANFGLTGNLSKDESTGNVVNGIIMKWSEPLDAAKPEQRWRLYVFKEEALVETLHLHRQSSYLVGRDARVADIVTAHPSCSKQHAVIQFRKVKRKDEFGQPVEVVLPYLMDLQSAQKTFVNGVEMEDSRYYELRQKDCIKFGVSTREYVLLHDTSDQQD